MYRAVTNALIEGFIFIYSRSFEINEQLLNEVE